MDKRAGDMDNKSLCATCIYEEECTFKKKFPVLECEEFSCEEK